MATDAFRYPRSMLALPILAGLVASLQAAPSYQIVQKISIGGEGGWDYLTMDAPSHRLFISRGTHVMVLDVNSGKLVGDIPNTPGIHGVAIASKSGKGYTSNGRENSVTVFDLKTLKELKRIPVGTNPDAICYEPASNRIFTFNGRSSDATAIDVATDTVAGTVKLDGKPEAPAFDGKGTLWVNIEDKNEIQQIDTRGLKVTRSWPITPGEAASGLAFDAKDGLLFSTADNGVMAISDIKGGKIVGTPKIGEGPDAAAFDPKLKLAFSSNGQAGTVTVIGKKGKEWDVLETIPTMTSARTMALDPSTHRIYLIAAQFQAPVQGQRRGQMVPDSAVILVLAPKQ